MTLPNTTITPIPETEPPAVPSLWNTRYEEIDENFTSIDERVTQNEEDLAGVDVDMQNATNAGLLVAMDAAGLANRELERWKTVRMQEGEVTVLNRGVIAGCAVTRAAELDGGGIRNLNCASGKAFGFGVFLGVPAQSNATVVPSNNGAAVATCYVYLIIDNAGSVQCDCTDLGEAVPDNGIELCRLSVPAGNNESTDPYLAAITITDTRRMEPQWPLMAQNPAWVYVALPSILPDGEYAVYTEIQSFVGGEQQCGRARVEDRLQNGFKLYLTGAADSVRVRYTATRVRT